MGPALHQAQKQEIIFNPQIPLPPISATPVNTLEAEEEENIEFEQN